MDACEHPNETSVLAEAARSGCGAMIDAVVATMSDLLTQEKVRLCVL